jgi:hypothetical protein
LADLDARIEAEESQRKSFPWQPRELNALSGEPAAANFN